MKLIVTANESKALLYVLKENYRKMKFNTVPSQGLKTYKNIVKLQPRGFANNLDKLVARSVTHTLQLL